VLNGILLLLISQLAGEALARGSGIGIPGPVLGMAMLATALLLWPRLQAVVAPVAAVLLSNLSLLFVPAAVGVVQVLPLLASEGLAIGVSVVVSTIASLIVTAFTFRAVVRLRDR
jgi:putative effector of murein hydrolase LrgA (UPF0299 family)